MEPPPPPAEAALYSEPGAVVSKGSKGEENSTQNTTAPCSPQGTIKAFPGFNNDHAEAQVKNFKKAFAGWGTDEARIIRILTTHNNEQRQVIKKLYKVSYGVELSEDLEDELSGYFEDLCLALLKPPSTYDAESLHAAIEGIGTDDELLIEVICPRSNEEIRDIKAEYKRLYGVEAEEDVKGDTSGDYRRLMTSMLQANRDETQEVNVEKAREDAKELYDAGEGKNWGTDESVFNRLLCLRSRPHLNQVFQEYKGLCGKDILQSLDDEFSGDILDSLVAIVKSIRDPTDYFTWRIKHAVDNWDDRRLMVCRSEIDLADIKKRFTMKYHESLAHALGTCCSGDYRSLLLSMLNPPMQVK